jgi:cytochrome c
LRRKGGIIKYRRATTLPESFVFSAPIEDSFMSTENSNDPLLTNKIAAALLAALLLVVGLPQVMNVIAGGGSHGGAGEALHLAYCCVDLETLAGPAAAAEEATVPLAARLAEANAAAGERQAALCKSCHTFEAGGASGTGPNLWNVVGRSVASRPDFAYSGALEAFGGQWSYERLDAFLENSQSYVPGTAMVQRLGQGDRRANILAYLQTLSSDPVPFPEPSEAATSEEDGAAAEADPADGGPATTGDSDDGADL